MGKYSVELKASARKELERLPAKLIQRIFPKLEGLASEPRPAGCKKLKGGQRDWRIRVGEYRVIYAVDDGKGTVDILVIRHRSETYR